jgi:hypothetical protein
MSVSDFLDLSYKLCGVKDLSSSLADEYFSILHANEPNFENVMEKYRDIVDQHPADIGEEIKKQLVTEPAAADVLKKIIKLWYLGRYDKITELRAGEHYFHYEALIWKLLHSHPAGMSGGYFGYWAYKPDN